MVADIAWLVVVQEAVGAVVDGQPEDRHIIGVHHAVREAYRLPVGDQRRGAIHHIVKPQGVAVGVLHQLWPVMSNHIVRQLLHLFRLAAVVPVLEVAEAHVALGDAHQHRATLRGFAPHRRVAGDDRERPGAGNAEVMHCLAGEVFAHRGAHHRPAIAHARVRRQPGALQMPVHFAAIGQALLAQQNAAPVAKLSGPDAELMPAVDLRQRRHAGQQRFAAPHRRAVKQRFGDSQLRRQFAVMPQQTAVGQRLRAKRTVEARQFVMPGVGKG